MVDFRMPSLGADMAEGVLLEWLVQPGDAVHRGDIVAVVDTQKAAVEVECFADGVVERLLVPEGTRVAVGTPLATIATDGVPEPAPVPSTPVPSTPVPSTPVPSTPVPAIAQPGPPIEPSYVYSPLVRHLAEERHVDLGHIRGTGFGGRITHADVERAAVTTPTKNGQRVKASPLARRLAAELGVTLERVPVTRRDGAVGAEDVRRAAVATTAPAAPDRTSEQRAQEMRKAIAALMARSKREIPHYYLSETIDLGPAVQWLHQRNRELPVSQRLVPSALLLKAAALAAAAVGELNGFWVDDRFVPGEAVHLGVAVSLRGGGLVAPAIHNADRKDLTELMAALRDLVTRTRAGRLRGSEMSDPTITVSNLGDQGVESILGVIYPPQVALIGFGRVLDRPWAVNGLLGIRPTVTVSLAADHRATDGATGSRFLQNIAKRLSQPEDL
jgi:pyruvate dehydrogenase E2 component (dihydrolipoamide acetyltransferase)